MTTTHRARRPLAQRLASRVSACCHARLEVRGRGAACTECGKRVPPSCWLDDDDLARLAARSALVTVAVPLTTAQAKFVMYGEDQYLRDTE